MPVERQPDREAWLEKALEACQNRIFRPHGFVIPVARVYFGRPHRARNNQALWVRPGEIYLSDSLRDKPDISLIRYLVYGAANLIRLSRASHSRRIYRQIGFVIPITNRLHPDPSGIGGITAGSGLRNTIHAINDMTAEKYGSMPFTTRGINASQSANPSPSSPTS